ncbi:cell division protein Cdc14 [Protomyces lactucae-debilis]|uniref:Cell division protein Cdc14 n=1 Tax=Protomyces lactucae-debilis TaxID=2754530 RepID=A0A1Y2EXN6_PROLT|nr:cell division protein Cdc14 [Protomyces lactucae-debilis]ORY76338.1 cell division protein Cdc14 [Protomyces lactucae-debilis]
MSIESSLLPALDLLVFPRLADAKQGLDAIERLFALVTLRAGVPHTFPGPIDEAYCSFTAVQDGFQGNVAGHLCHLLRRLLQEEPASRENATLIDDMTRQVLILLQGSVLLHPPSQALFARPANLHLLLNLVTLESTSVETTIAALTTLVCCLVDRPASLRVFEGCGGLASLCDAFKAEKTPHKVKIKMLEFFYFYLIREQQEDDGEIKTVKMNEQKQKESMGHWPIPRDLVGVTIDDEEGTVRPGKPAQRQQQQQPDTQLRTRLEKKRLLGEHLQNIDALVASFDELAPF